MLDKLNSLLANYTYVKQTIDDNILLITLRLCVDPSKAGFARRMTVRNKSKNSQLQRSLLFMRVAKRGER